MSDTVGKFELGDVVELTDEGLSATIKCYGLHTGDRFVIASSCNGHAIGNWYLCIGLGGFFYLYEDELGPVQI